MLKRVLAVCTALLLVGSPAIAANFDSLPTGHRAAFLNGVYLLAGSASLVIVDDGKVVGSSLNTGGSLFVLTIVNRANGVDNAALTSLELRLSDGTATLVDLPNQAIVLMTDIDNCANRFSERYDYPDGSDGTDSIVLSYCP